jgi:hypothetical protein
VAEARQIADRRPRGETGEAIGPERARPLGKASHQAVDDFREVALFDHAANDVGRSGFDHKIYRSRILARRARKEP